MLDALINLVKEHAQEAIVNNDAIPAGQSDAAIQEVAGTIQTHLSDTAQNGGLDSIMQMFGGQAGDVSGHPAVQQMISTATENLASRLGIDPAQAASIAGSLVPQVMNHFTRQTADPANSTFDLNSVISSFGATSQTGGLGGMLGGLFK